MYSNIMKRGSVISLYYEIAEAIDVCYWKKCNLIKGLQIYHLFVDQNIYNL